MGQVQIQTEINSIGGIRAERITYHEPPATVTGSVVALKENGDLRLGVVIAVGADARFPNYLVEFSDSTRRWYRNSDLTLLGWDNVRALDD